MPVCSKAFGVQMNKEMTGWRRLAFESKRQFQVLFWFLIYGALTGAVVSGLVFFIRFCSHFWAPALPQELPVSWALPDYSLSLGLALSCAALVAGQILKRLDGGRTHGPAHLILAIRQDKELDLRTGFLSVLLAMCNLSGGASVGAFGPCVNLGGLVVSVVRRGFSKLGVTSQVPRDVLLGAGTAAAVAALFSAPLGGVLFAFETISRRITSVSTTAFGAAALAGYLLAHDGFGLGSPLPDLSGAIQGSGDWPLSVAMTLALGLCTGGLSMLYMRAIVLMPKVVQWTGLPLIWRPWVPALLLFAVSPWFSHLLGSGLGTSGLAMTGALSLGLVGVLLLTKLAITPICMGFGFIGGVVSPAIFLGAMMGDLFQLAWPMLSTTPTPHFAIMAAAACVAGVIGAPWASVLMLWEMTGSISAALLSVLCVLAACSVSRKIFARSLFDWALK